LGVLTLLRNRLLLKKIALICLLILFLSTALGIFFLETENKTVSYLLFSERDKTGSTLIFVPF
jgi:cell division protein FtsL